MRTAAVVALALACARTGNQATAGEPIDVLLKPYIGRLVTATVTLGADSAVLLLDTGAGETLISPVLASRIGCEPTGRSTGFRMNGERVTFTQCHDVTLSIGGVAFLHPDIGVWDVQAVLPAGAPSVDGVLSLKTFASHPFTLRLADRVLTIESHSSYQDRIRGMTRLHARTATGTDGDELTVFLEGRLTGQASAWFLLDSGNLDVVQVAPHMATGAGETWDTEVTLTGFPPIPTTVRARDIIYDGALSESYLRQFVLTFDIASGEFWASPRPDSVSARKSL